MCLLSCFQNKYSLFEIHYIPAFMSMVAGFNGTPLRFVVASSQMADTQSNQTLERPQSSWWMEWKEENDSIKNEIFGFYSSLIGGFHRQVMLVLDLHFCGKKILFILSLICRNIEWILSGPVNCSLFSVCMFDDLSCSVVSTSVSNRIVFFNFGCIVRLMGPCEWRCDTNVWLMLAASTFQLDGKGTSTVATYARSSAFEIERISPFDWIRTKISEYILHFMQRRRELIEIVNMLKVAVWCIQMYGRLRRRNVTEKDET